MTDHTELKRLAEAATNRQWGCAGDYVCTARVEGGTTYVETWCTIADCSNADDAKFIAAANPAAVLALIAELKKVDADRKACWAEFKVQGRYIDQLKAENEALVSALNDILRVTPMGVEAFGIAALVLGELSASAMGKGEQP